MGFSDWFRNGQVIQLSQSRLRTLNLWIFGFAGSTGSLPLTWISDDMNLSVPGQPWVKTEPTQRKKSQEIFPSDIAEALNWAVSKVNSMFSYFGCCSVAKSCPTLCDPMSFTISLSFLKLMSIESVVPSNLLILCYPLLSCPQPSPASGFFPASGLFTSGGQNIGASASASVLLMNIQDWFPLGLTGWISLQSKGLSRVFSNTIVWKCQFFGSQPSLWFNSHIHIWLLEKP